jgi:hypothetical protein
VPDESSQQGLGRLDHIVCLTNASLCGCLCGTCASCLPLRAAKCCRTLRRAALPTGPGSQGASNSPVLKRWSAAVRDVDMKTGVNLVSGADLCGRATQRSESLNTPG